MGKHVCPICEDVYARRGSLVVSDIPAAEAWYCPECGFQFVSTQDATQLLKSTVAALGVEPPATTFVRHGTGEF
jgi:rubredoxin